MAESDVDAREADATPEEEAPEEEASEEEAPDAEAADAADETAEEGEPLSPFLQTLRAPISDDEPAGTKVTYDDDFQQLKTQIDEIGAASGGADYEEIVALARKVLTEKSKDLRAAGYLVIGEARVNGAAGVAESVNGIRLLLDTFWEELYPAKRRMRGRGNALKFVSDRLGDWLDLTTFEPDDRAALVAARDDLKAIQDFALQEMGEHAPALSGLLKAFDKAIKKLPEPEPEPDPEAEAEPEEAAEATKASSSSPDGAAKPRSTSATSSSSAAPAEMAVDADAEKAVTRAAAYYRGADATNPMPYRLMRIVRWGVLQKTPPSDGAKTRLEAPLAQRRTYLNGLLEEEDYETLVEEAEASFQAGTFHVWLDLQRLLATALGALGKPYEAAREAVLYDTARLVQRLPKLPTLTFSDGTPFADPLTADWLETQVQSLLGGDGAGGPRPSADTSIPAVVHYEEAREQLTAGDLTAALARMQEGAAEDATQKDRFYRRLYVATLCLKGGKPAVARPLLEALDEAIAQHDLDAWNPPLALEVWTALCQCYDQLGQQAAADEAQALAERADRVFGKICQVDAEQAVSVAERRPQ